MKQTIKSIFALVLVLCMLFTIVGCGEADTTSGPALADDDFFGTIVSQGEQQGTASNNDAASNTQNTSSNKDTTSKIETPSYNVIGGKSWGEILASMPKKLRGSKITVYNWNPADEYTGAPAVITKFTQQTGITVKWQTIPFDSYFTKLPAVIASGKDIPDVVRTRGPIPEYMLSYQPLSTSKFDFSDDAWDKDLMKLYTINGVAYAANLKNTHIGAIDLMFYNKSLIKKYDLEDPYKLWKKGKWNWEKYLEICRQYKNDSGEVASSGEGWYWSYLSIFGVDSAIAFDSKKGQFYNNMKSKDFLTLHQELGDLYNDEKLFAFGQRDFFNDGKRLFSIGTSIHMRRQNSYFGTLKSENNLYAVPMPARKGEKFILGLCEAEAYAIAKGASNPEAVPYFLRYFLDGGNYNLGTYFCNEQNLEVYNTCMNSKEKKFVYVYPDEIKDVDNTGLMGQTGDQMKNYIDSKMGTINKIVTEYNNTIKKIQK